jgi:hypothetical protein
MFGEDLVGSWRQYITADMLGYASKTLELFGLSKIYGVAPMPIMPASEALQS